jgi:hypothetical protein
MKEGGIYTSVLEQCQVVFYYSRPKSVPTYSSEFDLHNLMLSCYMYCTATG